MLKFNKLLQKLSEYLNSSPEHNSFLLQIFPNYIINLFCLFFYLIIIYAILKVLFNLIY
jgi:hypothetical protein